MLTAIFLHGHLGEKYGRKLMLDVDSVAGAISLLKANFAGFAKDVIGQGAAYTVWVGKTNLSRDELQNPSCGQDIHIVPAVVGAGGDSNIIQIIVGVILVIVGVFTSWVGGGVLISTGIGLIVGGVMGIIFAPNLKASIAATAVEKRLSRYFNGAVNTTAQGNPVPILYGRLVVGSQVISGSISDENT